MPLFGKRPFALRSTSVSQHNNRVTNRLAFQDALLCPFIFWHLVSAFMERNRYCTANHLPPSCSLMVHYTLVGTSLFHGPVDSIIWSIDTIQFWHQTGQEAVLKMIVVIFMFQRGSREVNFLIVITRTSSPSDTVVLQSNLFQGIPPNGGTHVHL